MTGAAVNGRIAGSARRVGRSAIAAAADADLLAEFAAGEGEASVEFVRRFQSRVYGLVLSMIGDPWAAEDVAQEVFVRVWRRASTYDGDRGTVAAWLLRIARNSAIDHLRRRRLDPIDPSLIADLSLASGDAVDTSVERAGADDQLRHILRGLPAEQSRALVLAACYGLTAAEISRFEGIPVGTVKTRVRLGLRKARQELVPLSSTPPTEPKPAWTPSPVERFLSPPTQGTGYQALISL